MRIRTIILSLSFISLLSCSKDIIRPLNGSSEETITVEEAMEAFEKQVAKAYTKLSTTSPARKKLDKLSPGDFAPVWKESRVNGSKSVSVLTAPIESELVVYAYEKKIDGEIQRPWSKVKKTVVARKDHDTGEIRVLMCSRVRKPGTRATAKFTGIEIYTSVITNSVLEVIRYEGGEIVDSADLTCGIESFAYNFRHGASLMKGYLFFSVPVTGTKDGMGGEPGEGQPEENNADEWEYKNFFERDDGLFEDKRDGSLYYDSDGDGVPDSMYISGAEVTGDGSCYGVGFPIKIENYWGPEYTPTNVYWPDDSTESGSKTDYSNEDPKDHFGTPRFYLVMNSFCGRLGWHQEYCINYGLRFCNEFLKHRDSFSIAGKQWCDGTLLDLQKLLYEKVLANTAGKSPDDVSKTLFASDFESMAFETHYQAYVENGFLELGLFDYIEVMKIVDKDMFTENGLKLVYNLAMAWSAYWDPVIWGTPRTQSPKAKSAMKRSVKEIMEPESSISPNELKSLINEAYKSYHSYIGNGGQVELTAVREAFSPLTDLIKKCDRTYVNPFSK